MTASRLNDGGKWKPAHCPGGGEEGRTGVTSTKQDLAPSELNSHILLRILPTHIPAHLSNDLHTNVFAADLFNSKIAGDT